MASVAIAMAAAFLLYMGIHTTAYDWIDRTQNTQEAYVQQKVRTEEALQQYIKDKNIALSDLSPLDEWVEREAYVAMVIYRFGRVIYSSYPFDVEDVIVSEEDAAEAEVMPVSDDSAYTFTFADGTASVLLMPFYEYRYYQWADRISVICGFLLFITVFLHLIQKKTSYIELLKKELQILEGGQMEYAVSVRGSDELGELAEGINRMRISILEREQKEAEARQANQELVTAMSHDLRSPLTSLLGYLELLDEEETEDAAQQKHFIATSRKKAMQIKEMSDRLFEYFLVYGREEKPAMEPVAQRLEMAVRISGKLPSSAGRGTLPDGRRGVGTAPCEPAHLAGIPQQPRVALHTFGREGALPGNGAARGTGSELPQAAGVRRFHEKVNG